MHIAILGTENSHAYEFAKLIKENEKYSDVKLVGIYGYDDAANERIISEGFCDYAAQNYNEFVGKVDGVMITARHGDLHHEYAMPYLRAGIPCFIDKPFAVKAENAEEMIAISKENGTLICGGSCLKHIDELKPVQRFIQKYGVKSAAILAPIDIDNEYGGFFFYAQHLLEMAIETFGTDIKSVTAQAGTIDQRKVTVVFNYGDFDVAGLYSGSYNYSIVVAGDDNRSIYRSCEDVAYAFAYELSEFVDMVKSGVMTHTYDSFLYPVKLLNAIYTSYNEKKEIEL